MLECVKVEMSGKGWIQFSQDIELGSVSEEWTDGKKKLEWTDNRLMRTIGYQGFTASDRNSVKE